MATISVKNVSKQAPLWYRKLKRVVNIGIIPSAVMTIKGLWVGNDAQLNRILIIITISVPALIEVIGMLIADDSDDGGQEITTAGTAAPTVNVNASKTP
jgi:hypothetical protein